jgi:hypothetical protein
MATRKPNSWGATSLPAGGNPKVTIQHNPQKDLDADFRRHDEPGNGLSGCVIPAEAGIQCWRMPIHRMYRTVTLLEVEYLNLLAFQEGHRCFWAMLHHFMPPFQGLSEAPTGRHIYSPGQRPG